MSFHAVLKNSGTKLLEFDAPRATIPEATLQQEATATSAGEAMLKERRPMRPLGEGEFVLVFGRGRKFARLHKSKGGCHWASLALSDSVTVQFVDPSMYNAKCKLCWPCKARADAPSRGESSATGSESSSSESLPEA